MFCVSLRSLPFVSLAGLVVAVGLVLGVFLVDAVVCQVHELVAQCLHGRRIPVGEETHLDQNIEHHQHVFVFTGAADCSLKVLA